MKADNQLFIIGMMGILGWIVLLLILGELIFSHIPFEIRIAIFGFAGCISVIVLFFIIKKTSTISTESK